MPHLCTIGLSAQRIELPLSDPTPTFDGLTRLDDQMFFGQVVFPGNKIVVPQSWRFLARPPVQSRSVSGLRYPLEDAGVAQRQSSCFVNRWSVSEIEIGPKGPYDQLF